MILKKTVKRVLAFSMSLAIAMTSFPMYTQTKAAEAELPDWLSARTSDQDIVIATTEKAGYSISAIASALGATQAADSNVGSGSVKTVNINVTDLSSWCVYDRYDTGAYANEAAYKAQTGYNTTLRPYFAVNDASNAAPWPTIILDDDVDYKDPQNWTIENAKKFNTGGGATARRLKEHVASGLDENGAANIYWYGYSAAPGTDWAFYPAAEGGKKTVDYKVDARKIFFHTVPTSLGTGFLFNTKISEDGKIYGYAVMTNYLPAGATYGYPSGINGFSIYKLAGVEAAALHTVQMTTGYAKELKTVNLTDCTAANGYGQTQVHMEITDDKLSMSITAIGENAADAEPVTVFDKLPLDATLAKSGISYESYSAGGFGPIVSYISHACSDTSSVDFTDLKMSISTDGEEETQKSVLDGYANADYTQSAAGGKASKKYYVLIGDNTVTDGLYEDYFYFPLDAAFLELMKKENVVLITNLEIKDMIDGSDLTQQGATGYNLEDYLGKGNAVHIDIPKGTSEAAIAAAVYQAVQAAEYKEDVSVKPALSSNSIWTGTNVVVKEKTTGCQVELVNTSKTSYPDDGAVLIVDTSLGTEEEDVAITVTGPGGEALPEKGSEPAGYAGASYDSEKREILLPKHTQAGIYRVEVSYKSEKGVSSFTEFEVTSRLDVTFNGGTDKQGTKWDGCSTTNTLGAGVVDNTSQYVFEVKLDDPASGLRRYEITCGQGENEKKLNQGTDYTVAVSAGKYTFIIKEDVMKTIADRINVTAHCGNVFNKIDEVNIQDKNAAGANIVYICYEDVDFTAYLCRKDPSEDALVEKQFEISSDGRVLVPSLDYRYYPEDGRVEIFGDRIGSELTFTRVENLQNIQNDVENATLYYKDLKTEATIYKKNTTTYLYIKPDEHYLLPTKEELKIYYGDTLLEPDAFEYSYDEKTGKVSVWAKVLKKEITILRLEAEAHPEEFSVTTELSGISYLGADTAVYNTDYCASMTAEGGLKLPDEISVRVGKAELDKEKYSYLPKSGEIRINGAAITGDIVIRAESEKYACTKLPQVWAQAPSGEDKKDGKVLGVDDTMEYRKEAENDWNSVSGNEIGGLAGEEVVLVRYKETATTLSGNSVAVTVPPFAAPPKEANTKLPQPTAQAPTGEDKKDGKVLDVDDTMEYRKDAENTWTSVSGNEIGQLAGEEKLWVRYKETDTTLSGNSVSVIVPPYIAPPKEANTKLPQPTAKAPSGEDKKDGKVLDVDDAMEYRKDAESNWTDISGDEIGGLAGNEMLWIRYKETETMLAGDAVSVTVPPYVAPPKEDPPAKEPAKEPEKEPAKEPVKQPADETANLTNDQKETVQAFVIKYGLTTSQAIELLRFMEKNAVPKDTLAITDETILGKKDDGDLKGSYFAIVQARTKSIKKNAIQLTWNRIKGADGYLIYGNKCGKGNSYKFLKDVKGAKKTTYTQKKLTGGTYYKYIVRAYKLVGGKKITIAASKTIHACTMGGKNGVAKTVKLNKSAVTLKKGKTFTIKAKEIKQNKPIVRHRGICYESDKPDVAAVSKKGVIRAKKKGKCNVYVYAQNGAYKKIKVTVK